MRALDREDLIIPATRYYMGRMTIGVTAHCRALAAVWPTLSENVRATLKRDIEEAFARDDAMRADEKCSATYYPLGQDIDRAAWELVRAAWRAHETKGGHIYSPRPGTEVCSICGFREREHAPEHMPVNETSGAQR